MSDLISRQQALKALRKLFKESNYKREYFNAIDAVEDVPSAEPEIIHCKDCRHNGSFDTDCPIDWNGKEYCSFAER